MDANLWLVPGLRDRVEGVAAQLGAANQTLVTVECTLGGALGHLLTNVPGASAWYLGGVVPYAARAKETWLGLGAAAFAGHGAASPEAARRLAEAAQARLGATWALAETGLLGPRGGRRSAKDPGSGFLCLAGPDGRVATRLVSTGLDDRLANKRAFLVAAVELLAENISTSMEIPVV